MEELRDDYGLVEAAVKRAVCAARIRNSRSDAVSLELRTRTADTYSDASTALLTCWADTRAATSDGTARGHQQSPSGEDGGLRSD